MVAAPLVVVVVAVAFVGKAVGVVRPHHYDKRYKNAVYRLLVVVVFRLPPFVFV